MANRLGHVLAVEDDMARRHLEPRVVEEFDHAGGIAEWNVRPRERQCDRPVHGAGVEELEPEPPGQALRGRALPGAGGPVDRHDHGAHRTGRGANVTVENLRLAYVRLTTCLAKRAGRACKGP